MNDKNKIILFIIIIVYIATPLICTVHFVYPYHSLKRILFEFCTLTAAIFLFKGSNLSKILSVKFSAIDLLFLLFVGFLFINLLFISHDSWGQRQLIYIALFYLLITKEIKNRIHTKQILYIFGAIYIGMLIESIIVMDELLLKEKIISADLLLKKPVLMGTFGNPNAVAAFIASSFPLALAIGEINMPFFRKKMFLGSLALCIMVLLFTYCRNSWLSIIIGVIFYYRIILFKYLHKYAKYKIFVIIPSFILVFLILYFLYILNPDSVIGRYYIWRISLTMISVSPLLGIGMGSFGNSFANYQGLFFHNNPGNNWLLNYSGNIRQCHNEYLQLFVEGGILGFILLLILIILIFFIGSKLSKSSEQYFIINSALSSLIVILVQSCFDNPIQILPVLLILLLNISIISCHCPKISFSKYIEPGLHFIKIRHRVIKYCPFSIKWIILPLCFIILEELYFIYNKTLALYSWQEGIYYSLHGDPEKSLNYFHKAENTFRKEPLLQFNLGTAYYNSLKYDEAIKYLSQSLKESKEYNCYLMLSFSFFNSGDFRMALSTLDDFSAKYPGLLLPHLLKSKFLFQMGDFESSHRVAQKVIKMKPKLENSLSKNIKNEAHKIILQSSEQMRIKKYKSALESPNTEIDLDSKENS